MADNSVKLPVDDISTTINYETIYNICKLEMKKPVKMIETLAASILAKIKSYYKDLEHPDDYQVRIKNIRIRVSKFNPPMGGKIARAYVEIEG
jgi:dihydroneopterin aldolase